MRRPLGLGKSSAFGDRGLAKRLDALASQGALTGGRLLDVGCGDGAYTIRLAEGFERVDAIDIQGERRRLFAERLRHSPLAGRIAFHDMSVDRLGYDDGTFDVITAIEVLEHVAELDRALREIHRVLKPGGRFSFTTPNRWFPFETHGVLYRGRRYPPARAPFLTWIDPLHERLADARTFTAVDLRRRLAAAGLRTAAMGYIMPPFDRSQVGRRLRPLTDRIERTPLRVFGMALVGTARKPY